MGIRQRLGSTILSMRLGSLAKRVKKERLTYLSPIKLHRIERGLRRVGAAGLRGDYLEFGVALGGSSIVIAAAAMKAGNPFTGFDVFAMIPPPTSEKDDAKSKDRYKTIVEGKSKGLAGDQYYGYRDDLYGDVVRAFARHDLKVDGQKIALNKGLFEQTWPARPPRPIAFAHIDCDWYDPVKFCLEAVAPHLLPGGIVILDDYHDYGGCRVAVDEFIKANRHFTFEDGANPILLRIS